VLLKCQSLSRFRVCISTSRSAIPFVAFLTRPRHTPQIRPRPLPSASLPIHYSLNTPPVYGAWPYILTLRQ
jgi:hypothetical protein